MLTEKILKLKQEVNSVAISPVLAYIKLKFVEKIEIESKFSQDIVFKDTYNKMLTLVNKCLKCIQDYNSINELKNAYSEAYIYSKLKSLLVIEKNKETYNRTPDFRVNFANSYIYIEMKALNMVEAGIGVKEDEIMENALSNKIKLEEQINEGKEIAVSEQIIQLYKASGKPYDSGSAKNIILTLINKIGNNFKPGQFTENTTILLIDLCDQQPIHFPELAILKNYDLHNYKQSGILWHTAFGTENSEIYRIPQYDGSCNYVERLDSEGILISYPLIKGLIFHINETFYALTRAVDENVSVIELMEYVCPKNLVVENIN